MIRDYVTAKERLNLTKRWYSRLFHKTLGGHNL